jgi:NADP-dependent 3-hydroxy acid dehydrogenase YdfG
MSFKADVAIVTGAASGMGGIYARKLLEGGAKLGAFDMGEEGLNKLQSEFPDQVLPVLVDISDADAVTAAVAQVREKWGFIDFVVNAAGIMPTAEITSDEPARMRKIMRVNVEGTMNMVMETVPHMEKENRGTFIGFGSMAGYAPTPHFGAYCASKAAVNSFLEILDKELRHTNVGIHLVCPPMVNTPLVNQAMETSSPKSLQEALDRKMLADPNDIVRTIDKGVTKGTFQIMPGLAKGLYYLRRFTPSFLWWLILKSEYGGEA